MHFDGDWCIVVKTTRAQDGNLGNPTNEEHQEHAHLKYTHAHLFSQVDVVSEDVPSVPDRELV